MSVYLKNISWLYLAHVFWSASTTTDQIEVEIDKHGYGRRGSLQTVLEHICTFAIGATKRDAFGGEMHSLSMSHNVRPFLVIHYDCFLAIVLIPMIHAHVIYYLRVLMVPYVIYMACYLINIIVTDIWM